MGFFVQLLHPAARRLRCWHPGFGVVLTGQEALRRYRGRCGYTVVGDGVTVSDAYLRSRLDVVRFVAQLLAATAQRPAQLNCFGLHEWPWCIAAPLCATIVCRYGCPVRPSTRSSSQCRCAARILTRFASSRRRRGPQRDAAQPCQANLERATGMPAHRDGSVQVVLQVGPVGRLRAAVRLPAPGRRRPRSRHAASPYDLSGYGYPPIAIEHGAGRAEYVRCQRAIAQRAARCAPRC
ncbi:hypothetical protein I552_6336 [Mycobacterium xenopi 3993]|nr:hypothetical protein I552_6336 [Mycobacterium xenopi 3993]